ncbi:MAG: hypothetical protein KJN71_04225 [Acidimicrobiia bacterium]|nr:hypothetical protein [Acidimicrobiia bacterium]
MTAIGYVVNADGAITALDVFQKKISNRSIKLLLETLVTEILEEGVEDRYEYNDWPPLSDSTKYEKRLLERKGGAGALFPMSKPNYRTGKLFDWLTVKPNAKATPYGDGMMLVFPGKAPRGLEQEKLELAQLGKRNVPVRKVAELEPDTVVQIIGAVQDWISE